MRCDNCGNEISVWQTGYKIGDMTVCSECHKNQYDELKQKQKEKPVQPSTQKTEEVVSIYAGFWRRFLAYWIDFAILFIAGSILITLIDYPISPDAKGPYEFFGVAFVYMNNPLGLLFGWLYFALFESSDHQATLGKKALGIKVTDKQENKIGFGKASGRHFGKIISSLIIGIGYLMAAFTEKKQALHDKMAGCLVIKNT